MSDSEGYITYQSRSENSNASVYATFSKGKTSEGKKNNVMWLGRVVDKDNGIYHTRKLGFYKFSIDKGIEKLDYNILNNIENNNITKICNPYKSKSSVTLDFGDIFVVNEALIKGGLIDLFTQCIPNESDTLISLMLYRILESNSYVYAQNWWEESYARYAFPQAKLDSQRISEFFIKIGDEAIYNDFLDRYIPFVLKKKKQLNVLVDSTGLPNDIKIPITSVNNHNGIISNEIRLIAVKDMHTGYPIYYKYAPGNIVDVTTLPIMLEELKALKIKVKDAIMDAGYYSEEVIMSLFKYNIEFMTRLTPTTKTYSSLIDDTYQKIENIENFVKFRDRVLFVKKTKIELFGRPVSAFVCLDTKTRDINRQHYYTSITKSTTNEQLEQNIKSCGFFIIITTKNLSIDDVLPLYYTRQGIEQIFDYLKNDINIIPLRCHSEDTLKGHLFLCFLASISHMYLHNKLATTKYSVTDALTYLRRFHCRKFNDTIIPDVTVKNVNNIIKAFKVYVPRNIPLI
jgi:hypothetical protein